MYIDIEYLFLHRQYVGHPIYYYFDKKSYTIVKSENPDTPPKSDTEHYERYIPMFRIDEEKIVNDYLVQINNPKLTSHLKSSEHDLVDIAEFLIRYYPDMSYDWHRFYDSAVYEVAIAWCEENHIKYKLA